MYWTPIILIDFFVASSAIWYSCLLMNKPEGSLVLSIMFVTTGNNYPSTFLKICSRPIRKMSLISLIDRICTIGLCSLWRMALSSEMVFCRRVLNDWGQYASPSSILLIIRAELLYASFDWRYDRVLFCITINQIRKIMLIPRPRMKAVAMATLLPSIPGSFIQSAFNFSFLSLSSFKSYSYFFKSSHRDAIFLSTIL